MSEEVGAVEAPKLFQGRTLWGKVRNVIVRSIDTKPIRERPGMKVEEAEERLKDYLFNGIAAEIF
jgi:hypothetical protein